VPLTLLEAWVMEKEMWAGLRAREITVMMTVAASRHY
jgi:hypothetical protein